MSLTAFWWEADKILSRNLSFLEFRFPCPLETNLHWYFQVIPIWNAFLSYVLIISFFFFFLINLLFFGEANFFTILYWFCHTLTWIHHGCTCVPHLEPPSHLPPHTIPLGHASAPARSTLSHASNLDWQSVSDMIIYMFQCHSPKSSHPGPLPQSPKDCFNICVSFAVLHIGLLSPAF